MANQSFGFAAFFFLNYRNMKLTDKEIKDRIKDLKPLVVKKFNVVNPIFSTLTPAQKISNDEILKGLQDVFEKETASWKHRSSFKEKSSLKKTSITSRDSFYKAKIGDLDFRASETLFSPQFTKKTQEILADKDYDLLTQEEVTKIHESLQDLSTFEFEWKEYNRRAVTKETTHNLFKAEFSEFESKLRSFCFPSSEDLQGQRAERKFMSYKVGLFAKSLVDHLYQDKQYKPLEPLASYSSEKLGQIIVDSLEARRIFNDLSRISIKRAHEKLLNYNRKEAYKDNVLSIDKDKLAHDFRLSFAVEIIYAIMNFGEKNHLINPDVADVISRDIQASIYYKSLLTSIMAKDSDSYLKYSDLTHAVFNMFVSSGFFTQIVQSTTDNNSKGKPMTTVQLVLPDRLTIEVQRPFKFPNIVRPKLLKKQDIDYLVKPLINGKGDLTKSDNLVTALNISRSKPHKVNNLLLRLCHELFRVQTLPSDYRNSYELADWLTQGDIDLKTPHHDTIWSKQREYDKLKRINDLTEISLKIVNAVSVQLSKQFSVAIKFSDILQSCGITKVERQLYLVTKQLDTTIASDLIDSKYLQSRLFLATYLRSFPIYITDTLCIRLRKYPREHWLSRTAGEFKHLLENFQSRKLTLKGFQNLLTAYYQANPDKLELYNQFIRESTISKKNGMATLSKYFQNNPLDFTQIKKPMYFLNLHLALLKAINENYETAVNVEVDQNASALVILSLVLRSKSMAKSSNVLGGDIKVSPYDFIKSKAKEFFDTIGIKIILGDKSNEEQCKAYLEDNHDVIEFICNSRNLHKYAIMCFCYNQTATGRMEDFAEEWINELGYLPNGRQRKALNSFATCYPDFVEFVYPNTQRKLNILKDVIEIVCQEAPKISIRTLDGEVINWAFYATKTQKRKYYDVVDKKHKSYHADVLKERKKTNSPNDNKEDVIKISTDDSDFPENLQLDSSGMKRRFLSYLIHSIDASILRRIINKMKKEHKSSINHLHDCVILHPNDLDSLYTVIKEIYSTSDLYNIVEFGVFNQIESSLSPEGKERLTGLKTEFFSLTDDFESELKNINPLHMYSLED